MAQPPQPQPMAIPQPQPVVFEPVAYTESTQANPSKHPFQRYKKVIFIFGIVEVVLASIALILGIAAASFASNLDRADRDWAEDYYYQAYRDIRDYYFYNNYNYYCRNAASWAYISHGIWSGLFLIITGILGILLFKKNLSRCMYIANMSMAIISATIVFVGMVLSAFAATISASCDGRLVVMHVVVAILCFAAMVIAILHASFCCVGVCYKNPAKKTQKAQYMSQQNEGSSQPQYVQGPNGQILLVTTTAQQQPPTYQQNPAGQRQQLGDTKA